MRESRVMTDGLRASIERSGYYPGLVSDAVASALGSEPVTAYVVHHDAIFDPGMEVRRHMTVLVLTPTRLVYSHTDEHPAEDADSRPRAETSTEAVRFAQISSVALTRVVPDPAVALAESELGWRSFETWETGLKKPLVGTATIPIGSPARVAEHIGSFTRDNTGRRWPPVESAGHRRWGNGGPRR